MAANKWFNVLLVLIVNVFLMTCIHLQLLKYYDHHKKIVTTFARRQHEIVSEIDDMTAARDVESLYPNFPITFWYEMSQKKISDYDGTNVENSCAPFPDMLSFRIENRFWQHFSINQTAFSAYSAFLDIRPSIGDAIVRVLGMVDKPPELFPDNFTSYFCQIWYANETIPSISKLSQIDFIWRPHWKVYRKIKQLPYLMGCKVPVNLLNKVPEAVSIVKDPCDQAENLLKVTYVRPKQRKDFSVCVKGLDFLQTDISIRLMEWLELLFILGVDKVYLYQLQAHPNVRRALDQYTKTGKVDLREITLPPGQPNIPIVQHLYMENHFEKKLDELIPYNDCFYRNIYSYKYVVFLDIDEIIIPTEDFDWTKLISRMKLEARRRDRIQKRKTTRYASFNTRNAYFLDAMQKGIALQNVSNHLHMLQHVYRSKTLTKPRWFAKTFFDTSLCITCHNHFPIKVVKGSRVSFDIAPQYALMHHYRKDCHASIKCEDFLGNTTEDTQVWKYKDTLLQNLNRTLSDMGFFLGNQHLVNTTQLVNKT